MNYKQIKNQSNIFLHNFYQKKDFSFPINVLGMIKSLHYQLEYKDLPDYLVAYTDMIQKKIFLTNAISELENRNNKGRVHFTLAHEIAHIILHEKIYLEKLAFCTKENNWEALEKMTENEKLEKEADIFASHLILPRDLLKKEITQYFGQQELFFSGICLLPDISLPIIQYLKGKTKASENAIIIALRDINIIVN
jgi:Zn-dependent peptidase ImmA (M78 family)